MPTNPIEKFLNTTSTITRAMLNAKYPTEFEVYMIYLELTDSNDKTVDSLSFPIMPNQIGKSDNKRITTKKSGSGVTVISSSALTPQEITLKGDFGKSFKILLKPKGEGTQGFAFTGTKSLTFSTSEFDGSLKTGFGAIKYLQSIIDRSTLLDQQGKPHRLYLYNMALSESYLVTISPSGLNLSQALDKNMIWSYSLTFNIIAPLDRVIKKKNTKDDVLKASVVQNFANIVASEVKSMFL